MSEPFIAEIRIFAGNFAPRSWAFCEGQLLPISQNTALYSLIGTTYGGDGRSTMGLPNLKGRAPMHPGRGPGLTTRRLGENGGVQEVTLSSTQMPSHNHVVNASSEEAAANTPDPNLVPGADYIHFSGASNFAGMSPETVSTEGGSQPHYNMQPFLGINFIIALQGLYPSRS
ncbi:MAG: tail fiber protein [Pseudomonadota bacterium]